MCRLTDDLAEGRFDEDAPEREAFVLFLLFIGALLFCGWMLAGCMTVEVHDSLLVNSSVEQDKPVRAGLSTTGEAIGEALKAAGYGSPISLDDLKAAIQEYRKLKESIKPQSRVHPFKWELRRCSV